MTTFHARVSAGVPAGGQFAPTSHPESGVSLPAPSISSEYIKATLGDRVSSHEILNEVARRANESRNFSEENLRQIREDIWYEKRGYTLYDYQSFEVAIAILRRNDPKAADAAERYVEQRVEYALRSDAQERASLADGTFDLPAPAPLPDGKNEPVHSDDPRVQAGAVFDRVIVDGTEYFRSQDGTFPNSPYSMRLQFNRPITDDEAQHLNQLLGYGYAKHVRGENLQDPERDSPFSYTVFADTTKGSAEGVVDLEEDLPRLFREGSDPRKTNRVGPIGSRLVEPFPDSDLTFEIYYDDVYYR